MDYIGIGVIILIIVLVMMLCWKPRFCKSESEKMQLELDNHTMQEMRRKALIQTEKDGKDYYDLLFNDICPLCGEKVETELYGSVDQFSDHKCSKCGFVTKGEVLV